MSYRYLNCNGSEVEVTYWHGPGFIYYGNSCPDLPPGAWVDGHEESQFGCLACARTWEIIKEDAWEDLP